MPVNAADFAALTWPQDEGSHVLAPAANVQPAAVGASTRANSTHYPLGARIVINKHIYVCTTAGTSASSLTGITWNTAGGTTTDNGVTWTDLGTVGPQVIPQGYMIPASNTSAGKLSRANRPWTRRGRAQYIGRPIAAATLAANGDTTPPSYFASQREDGYTGGIDLSLSGTWTGTIYLERSFDSDAVDDSGTTISYDGVAAASGAPNVPAAGAAVSATWQVVDSYTANTEKVVQNYNASVKWRLRAGSDISGSCVARLSQV